MPSLATGKARSKLSSLAFAVTFWICGVSDSVAQQMASSTQTIVLGAEPTSINLQAAPNIDASNIFRNANVRRYTLYLKGITAARSAEASYLVFLNATDAKDLSAEGLNFVGALVLFGGVSQGDIVRYRPVSFEISDVLVRIARAGRSHLPITITFKPTAAPSAGSMPSVEEISVFGY